MNLFLKAILIWLAFAAPTLASTVVIDGDTIEIGNTTYCIFGIDAPECGKAPCGVHLGGGNLDYVNP